jgi:hypothetical protein
MTMNDKKKMRSVPEPNRVWYPRLNLASIYLHTENSEGCLETLKINGLDAIYSTTACRAE